MTDRTIDRHTVLVLVGTLFLGYALLGNYIALPGYIRFLERGGTSEAGNAFDLNVLIGATKTILWMFSFQIGVLCLGIAYARKNNLLTRYVVLAGAIWLPLWSWPVLPAPNPIFYILLGTVLLICIGVVLTRKFHAPASPASRTMFLGSVMFFAVATWEVCGLGTTGRMLHPEEASELVAHNILVTQSSKLMVEFAFAWLLLGASLVGTRSQKI